MEERANLSLALDQTTEFLMKGFADEYLNVAQIRTCVPEGTRDVVERRENAVYPRVFIFP